MSIKYYPIIKWKKGEQEALKNVNIPYENFYPIIEIVDECSPNDFFTALPLYYSEPIYFDVRGVETEYLNTYINYISKKGIPAYPVLYIDHFIDNSIDNLPKKFAVKIPIPVDFEGPTFEEILAILSSFQDNEINLILDAGEVIESRVANSTYDSYCRIISDNIDILSQFEDTIICLTSFPEQLSIESGEDMAYKRYDILIYKKIIEKYKDSELHEKIQYSDYGVTKFTETELDFSKMRYGILPKVKYTTEKQYIVKKGEKDRRNNIFTRSYIDMAKEIVNSTYYNGPHFSYGDQCIYDKANIPNSKPGNSQQWVTYCANHHFAVLKEQLSNLSDF